MRAKCLRTPLSPIRKRASSVNRLMNERVRKIAPLLLLALVASLRAQTTALPADAPLLPSLSPVILAEDPQVVERFAVDDGRVREMVNSELLKLTSATDIGTAWKRLGITPLDVVGIKITTMGGPALSSHRALVQAICDGLHAAGVPPGHIIIWDRLADTMRRAGYAPVRADETHVGIASVFPGTGYDLNVSYRNEILGNLIWGDSEFTQPSGDADLMDAARDVVRAKPFGGHGISNGSLSGDDLLDGGSPIPQTSNLSYYANLVTHICTKIVNVPVLTDNAPVGINGCLASLALACVDNNRRFQGDPTYGDPAICEILDKDFIRRKVVVNILDALIAEYAGGPFFNPQFTQSIGAIYVSRDPVAIDSLALRRIEAWRKRGHIDPLGKTASHVASAALYNLGTNDPRRIQLIRVP
jgi:hypothetical protein